MMAGQLAWPGRSTKDFLEIAGVLIRPKLTLFVPSFLCRSTGNHIMTGRTGAFIVRTGAR